MLNIFNTRCEHYRRRCSRCTLLTLCRDIHSLHFVLNFFDVRYFLRIFVFLFICLFRWFSFFLVLQKDQDSSLVYFCWAPMRDSRWLVCLFVCLFICLFCRFSFSLFYKKDQDSSLVYFCWAAGHHRASTSGSALRQLKAWISNNAKLVIAK